MSRRKQLGDAFRRRPPGLGYSRGWGFQLEGLLRAGEHARRGFAERLLAGVLLAVAVTGAVLIPRLLVGPPPGRELGIGAPSMTVPPVVLAPGLPGHKSKSQSAAASQDGATPVSALPSASTPGSAARTLPVTSPGAGQPPRTRPQPPAQPQPGPQPQPQPQPPPPPQTHAATPAPLARGTTICDGTYSGTGKDVVVPGAATCVLLSGTTIAHDLTVSPGGTLIDPAVRIGHDLVAHGPAGISIHGDSVGHDLWIDGLTGSAGVRNEICSTTVGHDLVVQGGLASAGTFGVGGGCPDGGNTVGHDLVVTGNANAVAVAGNSVGHDLRVQGVPPQQAKPRAPKQPHEPKSPEPPKPQHQPKPPKPPKPPEPPKPQTPKPPKPAKPQTPKPPKPHEAKPPKPPKPAKPTKPAKPSKPPKPHDKPKPPKPTTPTTPTTPAKPPKPPKPPKQH